MHPMKQRYLYSPSKGLTPVPWVALTMAGVALVLAGALAGFWLASFQHGVDGHISAAKWEQFEALKDDYQERFKGSLRVSAGEARAIVGRKDKERPQ